eukprot:CCRYP_011186-RA/>CCRYP_011186-RA protein AED:0.39 eAED:0.39 QI:0/-1/0/1/-1/1/1/0/244
MEQKENYVPLFKPSQGWFSIAVDIWEQGKHSVLIALKASTNFVVDNFDQKNSDTAENGFVTHLKNLEESVLAPAVHCSFEVVESIWSNVKSVVNQFLAFLAAPSASKGDSVTPSRVISEAVPLTMPRHFSFERNCEQYYTKEERVATSTRTLSSIKRKAKESTQLSPLEVYQVEANFPRKKIAGKTLSKFALKKHRRKTKKRAATIQEDGSLVVRAFSPVKSELGEAVLIKEAIEYISRNDFTG